MSDIAAQQATYPIGEHPDLPPPPGTTGIVGWMRKSLFAGPVNTALTVLTAYLLYTTIPGMLDWLFFDANISANSRAECAQQSTGA